MAVNFFSQQQLFLQNQALTEDYRPEPLINMNKKLITPAKIR
jgi:hypothetical protein